MRTRSGFTAIELLVVLGLLSAMAGMTANGVLAAQRRSAVNQAVAAVEQAVAHARVLARGNYRDPDDPLDENYAVVIDGDPQSAGVRIERNGEVVLAHGFGPHVRFEIDGQASSEARRICFANGTGFTTAAVRGCGERVSLGRDETLAITTLDGLVGHRFAICEVGLVRTDEVGR